MNDNDEKFVKTLFRSLVWTFFATTAWIIFWVVALCMFFGKGGIEFWQFIVSGVILLFVLLLTPSDGKGMKS